MKLHPVARNTALYFLAQYEMDGMDLYSGPMPATADVEPTGVLLARFANSEDATGLVWEDVPASSITDFTLKNWIGVSNLPWLSAPALANGTVGYAHIYSTQVPEVHLFASVGVLEGSGEALLSSLTTYAGTPVTLTKLTIYVA